MARASPSAPSGRSLLASARRALHEDRYRDDRTTRLLLPRAVRARATVTAEAPGVLAGIAWARALARIARVRVVAARADGRRVRPGETVLKLEGDARALLGLERTLLNYLMHLSGVASETARARRAVGGGAEGAPEIWATRKTIPGLRDAEKAAVVAGGGRSHRRDLSSAVLVKNNHLALVPLPRVLARLGRGRSARRAVEIEVRDARSALTVARSGVGRILIDNASPARARRIVRALERAGLRSRVWVELSGGITPRTAGRYRRVGADALSLGAVTHSAPALPFHLRLEPAPPLRRRPG